MIELSPSPLRGATLHLFPTSARTRVRLFPHLASDRDREGDCGCEFRMRGKMIVHGSWMHGCQPGENGTPGGRWSSVDTTMEWARGNASRVRPDSSKSVLTHITRDQDRPPAHHQDFPRVSPTPYTVHIFPRVSRTLPFLLSSCSVVPPFFASKRSTRAKETPRSRYPYLVGLPRRAECSRKQHVVSCSL